MVKPARNREVSIEVTSRHDTVSDRMRSYAIDKASKLIRFHDRISRIQIIVDEGQNQPIVEMILHVDTGETLVAKVRQQHFRAAIDLLVGKMGRQLKKAKEKRKQHKGDPSASGGSPLAAAVGRRRAARRADDTGAGRQDGPV
jgi:putative sigma-54 modulation protein